MKKNKSISPISVVIILVVMVSIISIAFLHENNKSIKARAANNVSGNDHYNIIFLGRDAAANLSDVLMLVSLDMTSGDVNIMQIPRDAYFNIGSERGSRINTAPRQLGVDKFASALGEAMGINIDFYISLDLDTVKEMVDLVSGIEIDIPMDMEYNDPAQGLSINLKKGKRVLNGEEALSFLRFRSGYLTGDLGRLDAQKLFLNALGKRVGEIKNPIVVYNLFKLISSKGITNIGEQEIISLGIKCAKLKGGQAYYLTAPGEAIQSEQSGAWYYILSKPSLEEILKARFGATKQEKSFDKDNKFVDKRVKSFYDIYNKRYDYKIYSAKEIENSEININ